MVHRRLAILDLSPAGAQPMSSADGRLRVVYNGEIYNTPELRADLEARGCVFVSHSDTEILLHLYRREGRAMASRLRGMFAFALWDEEAQGLLLARDPLGIKPLYIADNGRTFRVASQVKALLAGGDVDASPEPAGHVGFFLWGHVPEPFTLHRGVRAVPAGATLWVCRESGPEDAQPFFALGQELAACERGAVGMDARETEARLSAAIEDSVRHHMLADVPVGVFLSAGLDSTTIALLASRYAETPLRTITLGFGEFKDTPCDETGFAEDTARRAGFDHHTCWVGKDDFENDLTRLLEAMDQPSVDGVNTYFVSKAAHAEGLKVVLSGLGGDELLGGYDSFRQIPALVRRARHWRWAGSFLRRATASWIGRLTSPKYAGLLEYGGTYGGAYLLRRSLFMPWELPQVLDPVLVRTGLRDLHFRETLDTAHQSLSSPQLKISALQTGFYMRNQLLRDSDWASMAHSLELRVPLVDIELLRAVAPLMAGPHVPPKKAMASGVADRLPPGLLDRRKTGFGIPVGDWMRDVAAGRGLRGWARWVYRHWKQ